MKKLMYKVLFTFFLVVGLMVTNVPSGYSQCAMCRATVESNVGNGSKTPESQVGTGLNTGILYLMVIPYVLIGVVGFLWYKSNQSKKNSSNI